MTSPGWLAVPLLILALSGCSQAAPANQHQLQARLSSIPGKCGIEKAKLTAVSSTQVTMALPTGIPASAAQHADACIDAEVKKISGASLSRIGGEAGAAE